MIGYFGDALSVRGQTLQLPPGQYGHMTRGAVRDRNIASINRGHVELIDSHRPAQTEVAIGPTPGVGCDQSIGTWVYDGDGTWRFFHTPSINWHGRTHDGRMPDQPIL